MEPRQLFNIHKLCIVKHASKVSYMQPTPTIHTNYTIPPYNYPIQLPYTTTIHTNPHTNHTH
jgi:hypothetical protein